MQEISSQQGSVLAEHIRVINSCYPEEIVRYYLTPYLTHTHTGITSTSGDRYYSPGYSDTLLERVEQYRPSITQ